MDTAPAQGAHGSVPKGSSRLNRPQTVRSFHNEDYRKARPGRPSGRNVHGFGAARCLPDTHRWWHPKQRTSLRHPDDRFGPIFDAPAPKPRNRWSAKHACLVASRCVIGELAENRALIPPNRRKQDDIEWFRRRARRAPRRTRSNRSGTRAHGCTSRLLTRTGMFVVA